ncbi:amino acid permease family [Colletotrichum asianum]|uniref:Amino acid permease family n=1 Tax=Colletotrichum asianum TaxID=702518 RepID=A0A8H3VZH7_9PEZI|nr:amino acid permease family [Colletotrichum asianum]
MLPASSHSQRDDVENFRVETMGYRPSYRRIVSSIGNLALVISFSSPMTAVFVISIYNVSFGGYWGLTWGWLIPALLLFPQCLATAELSSSMPINGVFYWWTAALAPPSISRPLSFMVGWANVLAWTTGLSSFAFAVASSYASLIPLINPNWTPDHPQLLGISIALIVFWASLSCIRMERFFIFLIITAASILLSFLAFVVGIPASHASQSRPFTAASTAFGEYTSFSEWSDPVAVSMVFFGATWSITGWQAPACIAEGTHNARVVAPRAICTSYAIQATMGLLVCYPTAFCTENILDAASDPMSFPMFTLVINHWGLNAGVAFLLVCITTLTLGGASQVLGSASIIAAFARDGGLPYSATFARIDSRLNMPVAAMLLLCVCAALILLFALSEAASSIIYTLPVVTGFITYSVPIILRVVYPARFQPGPFNYGIFSRPIHAVAAIVMAYFCIMETFPHSPAWTPATFNYNWVVALSVFMFAAFIWMLADKEDLYNP